ncbi:tetratricopeptide repeat protein [Flavihumibacter solisilvae]|uniref:Tetratricopeptide repeat protein n=1 Tax=Flavihumibacter solisilvae TaxID=1349421 RepID=A0A0C1IJG0_9BACT|nr:tetratricopeptide repeat protein [Flavihumibacter solisilvae]KIC94330.1 hypothetical protein OI18_11915 [Flavihumibacter solisilvae]
MKRNWILPAMLALVLLPCCQQASRVPSKELVSDIDLKRGEIISCGAPGMQLGSAEFATSCSDEVKDDFNLAIKLLHSFEYDEAEKAFAKVIDRDPVCAMAYWGVAMANFHPLWTAPTEAELKKGSRAIEVAQSLQSSKKESDYIDAIAAYYNDWEKTGHLARCLNFEKGMEQVYVNNPSDHEAAAFYALALTAAADPKDKTFSKQKKAGQILQSLYPGQPNHPGIVHYLIHSYDYPELADKALVAARKYASIAPSSAHALHMPSHIFTRLGLWDEAIQSNLASVASAQCYARQTGIKGHWDEELHGIDYLVYAYLQKGQNDSAKKYCDYLQSMTAVQPVNFKVAYAFAASPARYLLENRKWQEAAIMEPQPSSLNWKDYPWQEAMIHFTRAMGLAHLNKPDLARNELREISRLHDELAGQKDDYKANQVDIQSKSAEAWILLTEGKKEDAVAMMQQAADMEDRTEKHPVTPGEVIPAKELLGDMLLQLNKPQEALAAYEADLLKHPNRFNALYAAGLCAEKTGNTQLAKSYFLQLVKIAGNTGTERKEIPESKRYLEILATR